MFLLVVQIVGGMWFLYWDEIYNQNMINDLGFGRTANSLALLLFYTTICLIFAVCFALWKKIVARIVSILLVCFSLFFSFFHLSSYAIPRLIIKSPNTSYQQYVPPSVQYGFSDSEIILLNIWLTVVIILTIALIINGWLSLGRLKRQKLR